jgi:hypothetical protein
MGTVLFFRLSWTSSLQICILCLKIFLHFAYKSLATHISHALNPRTINDQVIYHKTFIQLLSRLLIL